MIRIVYSLSTAARSEAFVLRARVAPYVISLRYTGLSIDDRTRLVQAYAIEGADGGLILAVTDQRANPTRVRLFDAAAFAHDLGEINPRDAAKAEDFATRLFWEDVRASAVANR